MRTTTAVEIDKNNIEVQFQYNAKLEAASSMFPNVWKDHLLAQHLRVNDRLPIPRYATPDEANAISILRTIAMSKCIDEFVSGNLRDVVGTHFDFYKTIYETKYIMNKERLEKILRMRAVAVDLIEQLEQEIEELTKPTHI